MNATALMKDRTHKRQQCAVQKSVTNQNSLRAFPIKNTALHKLRSNIKGRINNKLTVGLCTACMLILVTLTLMQGHTVGRQRQENQHSIVSTEQAIMSIKLTCYRGRPFLSDLDFEMAGPSCLSHPQDETLNPQP